MNIFMNKKIQYPDLAEVVYNSSSMDEVWKGYIARLREDGSMYASLYANKLEEFYDIRGVNK